MNAAKIDESTSGKRQYPKTDTDWKNETAPPSNLALRVTTAEPNQTITNTPVNIGTAWSSGAPVLNIL